MNMGYLLPSFFLMVTTLGTFPSKANATENPAHLCESAADSATARFNIPGDILRAIALTETGRDVDGSLRPWPWVLNVGGKAVWFHSQADTLDHANQLIATGITNFDVGCFQLNYRWHAANFDSLSSMIDPEINALYAAHFLTQKYADLGSWRDAVGAYHSATVANSNAYLARFEEIYSGYATSGIDANIETVAQEAVLQESSNRFPLLLPGNSGNGGSLVPTVGDSRPLIGDFE